MDKRLKSEIAQRLLSDHPRLSRITHITISKRLLCFESYLAPY